MGTRFLVSTTQHLLAIDPEHGSVWRVHSGKGLYFGLASDPNRRLYVACRNTTLGPKDESVRAAERGSILVFDSRFRLCDELAPFFPLRDVHGMEYIHGRLLITCSFDNMVAIYDISKAEWAKWYPAPNPAHRHRDVDHFNTLRLIEDQVWIVAHRFGASQLLAYDYPTLNLRMAIPVGNMAHDVLSYGGALATCSSADGCILNINGERLRTGNFPRGIAQSSSGTLLGISMDTARSERAWQIGILRWYTPEWRFVLDCVLPNVGMVLDVMELSNEHYSWDELDLWPFAKFSRSEYNQVSPGNNIRSRLCDAKSYSRMA